jgi:hypothetical protein
MQTHVVFQPDNINLPVVYQWGGVWRGGGHSVYCGGMAERRVGGSDGGRTLER